MKILVACELPQFALDELHALASELSYAPELSAEKLAAALRDTGVLVVDKLRVGPEAVSSGDTLQLVVRAGTGVENISVESASAAGVVVAHCPQRDAAAIAELTFGLVLALDRRIIESTLELRAGQWNRVSASDARGLAGRTLGILGCGAVGCAVARLGQAFGMKVLGWSPSLTPEVATEHAVEFCEWPRELARRCDVVTVHAPHADDQDVLIDQEFLESMSPGTILVHVGHPGTIDEDALVRAVKERGLKLGLDVFGSEPAIDVSRVRSRLLSLPGVVATPHIGSHTLQAREETAREVVRIVRSFLVSGELVNCVNLIDRSPATWQIILRVRDQVGVMAAILDAIRADGVNAQEISSRVFAGAKAAWCIIALDERPSAEALKAIRGLPDVLHLEIRAVV